MRSFWRKRRSQGSLPLGMVPVTLYSNPNAEYFYQEKQTYNWPSVPAHEQRSALVNCWTGNQLPGDTNFIPGVPLSGALWNIPTSYANTFKNQQFNNALNIQTSTPVQQANLLQQALVNWQSRTAY